MSNLNLKSSTTKIIEFGSFLIFFIIQQILDDHIKKHIWVKYKYEGKKNLGINGDYIVKLIECEIIYILIQI